MRILVTGSAGYIGRAACAALRQAGHEVQVADRYDLGPCQYDLTDEDDLESLGERPPCECIVHLAARAQALEGQERPLDYWRDNVTATENVLRLAQNWKARRIVFASSVSVYGETLGQYPRETARLYPLSLYGQSKVACEWLLRAAEGPIVPEVAILRLANVAGAVAASAERPDSPRIIPRAFAAATGRAGPLVIRGSHDYPQALSRDYVHLEDVCRAVSLAVDDWPARGLTVNVGRGSGVAMVSVLTLIENLLGLKVPHSWIARPACEPSRSVANVDLLASGGWRSKHDLTAIIRSAWERFQADTAAS